MDDIVKQALVKWPNVPHCYGWLALDARGNWFMRDDAAQAAGPFGSGLPGAKGSMLKHDKLIEFIQRNYDVDAHGQWFFQNGPQRVYVELEATPWVWRVQSDLSVQGHDGTLVTVVDCLLDELGRVYLLALLPNQRLALGLVHTQDVGWVAQGVESGHWVPKAVESGDLPHQFGYVRSPNPAVIAAAL